MDLQVIRANITRLLAQLSRPESLRLGDGGSLRTQALLLDQDLHLRVYLRHRDEITVLQREANELADIVDEVYQRYQREHA